MQTKTIEILPVGERVILDGAHTEGWERGRVIGHTVLPPESIPGEPVFAYLIRLDRGAYLLGEDGDAETFISVVVVAYDTPELRAGEE